MSNNGGARIAKNTVFLYCRMLLSMIVTLYTSRVILNALGAVDYGIYNLVTGFVVSFGFLNSAMHASVQRFLTIELKNDNYDRLNKIFSMGVIIHFILALVIVFLVELVGIYFLETKINVPSDRLSASVWIFHFSVVTLFFSIVNVPYKALIIAHEDMGIYAAKALKEVDSTNIQMEKFLMYHYIKMNDHRMALAIGLAIDAHCIAQNNAKEGYANRVFMAMSLYELEAYEEAISVMEDAALDETTARDYGYLIYCYVSACYRKLGDNEKADDCLKSAMEMDTKAEEYINSLLDR